MEELSNAINQLGAVVDVKTNNDEITFTCKIKKGNLVSDVYATKSNDIWYPDTCVAWYCERLQDKVFRKLLDSGVINGVLDKTLNKTYSVYRPQRWI